MSALCFSGLPSTRYGAQLPSLLKVTGEWTAQSKHTETLVVPHPLARLLVPYDDDGLAPKKR